MLMVGLPATLKAQTSRACHGNIALCVHIGVQRKGCWVAKLDAAFRFFGLVALTLLLRIVQKTQLRFGDVLSVDFALQRGQQPHGWCHVHRSYCAVGVEPARAGNMQVSVEAAGPTCCPFSIAGLQKKVPWRCIWWSMVGGRFTQQVLCF